jgi:hypothetical protein
VFYSLLPAALNADAPQRQGSVTGESKPNAHHVTRVAIATATHLCHHHHHAYICRHGGGGGGGGGGMHDVVWCGNSTRSVIQGKRSSSAGLELNLGCEGGEGEGCGFEFFSRFFCTQGTKLEKGGVVVLQNRKLVVEFKFYHKGPQPQRQRRLCGILCGQTVDIC